jgi:hypothetical protein
MATEQEQQFIALYLEPNSVDHVRRLLDRGEISSGFVHVTAQWLSDKEIEAERRKEASNSEQIELARRASEAANRAADAAEASADAARRQAKAAEKANTRATIAIVIAIASAIITAIVTVVGIWITHMDVHK